MAFFGDAGLKVTDWAYGEAYKTAALLAKEGYIIVNGGGPGIMAAATEGAISNKGKVELVILDPKKEPDNYEGTSEMNLKLADKIYITDNYQQRLNKLVEIADAFIVFKGGTGTLSEVGLAWEMAKFEYSRHEPVIFVGKEWREIVKALEKNMNYENKEREVVITVPGADEVLKALTRVESCI